MVRLQGSWNKLLMGLRQKIPKKEPQTYVQKVFDIILLSFLIYLGLGFF